MQLPSVIDSRRISATAIPCRGNNEPPNRVPFALNSNYVTNTSKGFLDSVVYVSNPQLVVPFLRLA